MQIILFSPALLNISLGIYTHTHIARRQNRQRHNTKKNNVSLFALVPPLPRVKGVVVVLLEDHQNDASSSNECEKILLCLQKIDDDSIGFGTGQHQRPRRRRVGRRHGRVSTTHRGRDVGDRAAKTRRQQERGTIIRLLFGLVLSPH